jgi:uncharacterized protein (DUF1778 family)
MTRRGRPPKGEDYVERVSVNYRLPPDILAAIKKAARRKKLSRTQYVLSAITDQLQKDGIA